MRMRFLRISPLLVGALTFVTAGVMPRPAVGQTPFVPYFGKNQVRYDRFDWHIYKTDHFEIFYYPALEQHLERVAAYAESAYQHVSAELKHDLAEKVPLIVFKTESEFQENHIGPDMPEGVLAFAEPERNRMVLPIDQPSDQLYQLITHELTHIFEFDIIPRGLGLVSSLPLWMDEGLSDYMAGAWNPLDLMMVRDVAISDNVPRMSELESQPMSGRTPYALGHATWEFIEARWGKEGLRQFLFSLRKSAHRRRRERVRRSAQAQARGLRRRVRPVSEGALQAVPRQGASGRLRAQPGAAAGPHATTSRWSPSSRRRRATCSRRSSATCTTRSSTSSCSRRATARSSGT